MTAVRLPTAAEWADPDTRAVFLAAAQRERDDLRRWNRALLQKKRGDAEARALRRLSHRHQREFFTLMTAELDKAGIEHAEADR